MRFLPLWFKQEIPDSFVLNRAKCISGLNVHTVCQEARCPNAGYCYKHNKITFMVLGNTCTRNCRFCAVAKVNGDKSLALDNDEPRRIAEAVKEFNLDYVVITSVTRDDLSDGGAGIFAESVKLIRGINKNIKIELLIPDFRGGYSNLGIILSSSPDLIAHNIETVKNLYAYLRPEASYEISLRVLKLIKNTKSHIITKSSLMLGLGEREDEVVEAMNDLRYNECDILTLGQYLSPSPEHYPVREFVSIEQFKKYEEIGAALGFRKVVSGPLVRSSYKAEDIFKEVAYA